MTPSVTRWYPEVVRLASYPIEEVRNTDAWVMGQDVTSKDAAGAGFHDTLLKMLSDSSLLVRGNAALSLVRFGDPTGRPAIVALLQPTTVIAPQAGRITDCSALGTPIHQGGIIAKIESGGKTVEVRSPISGRLRQLQVQPGQTVAAGDEVAMLDPGTDQVWEALRALYLIGQPDDTSCDTALMNANCRKFPTMCGNRQWPPNRRYGSARSRLDVKLSSSVVSRN